MTDRNPAGFAEPSPDEEIERLVLKGLGAPLSAGESARLDALAAASPERMARAQGLVDAWMLAGIADPQAVSRERADNPDRRWLLAAGIAAAVAAPAALWFTRRSSALLFEAPETGPLKAQLPDGTRITLSRGGRMEARLDERARNIRLLKGEAFYNVAKDAARPFRVEVDGHRLTVLGTRFNVNPAQDGLRVDLLEGSLRVEQTDGPTIEPVVLKPGQAYRAGRTPAVTAADVDAAAAWIEGRLVFDDDALAQVAAGIGRQTGQTLTFADPRLAALRFSGVLRLDNDQDWKPALEAVLPVRLSRTAKGYSVARR